MSSDCPFQPSKRILVVEDDRVMADVVRFALERAGFEIVVCNCGSSGWERFQQEPFDFVVVDSQMPQMRGEELVNRIRASARNTDVPVMLLSAKLLELDTEGLQRDLELHAVMAKPFSPRELVDTITDCLYGPAIPA